MSAAQTVQQSFSSEVKTRTFEVNERQLSLDRLVRRIGKVGLLFNPIFSFFFLWAPILVLVIFSFNDSRSVATFSGFTLRWYLNIFSGAVGAGDNFSTALLLDSLRNSLVIGVIATLISSVIGTMVSLALSRSDFPGKRVLDAVLYLPVVIPEITQGVSLAVFFNAIFGWWNMTTGQRVSMGLETVIIGHVAFTISFVAVVVRARLADMNPKLEEAARDLGANEWRTFWAITFPLALPGIIAGALLAFTLSLDDFLVTFFTSGAGTNTLPVFVYGLLRLTVTPEINAISTIMILASTLLIGISLALQGRNAVRG
ncbi:MAG: ABC transporter permease [Anaerolineae bacterium]|nr:ABC transporter permease [Anaerolineae bacterium]MDW8171830.1 ABC transporter permease [Anaerolineae bacterium]